MTTHEAEREIKAEQHHIPPDMPDNPDALEHEKRRMANLIGVVVVIAAAIFVIGAFLIVL